MDPLSIVSKLRELGWGEELDIIAPSNYHPLSENALVRPSKPLSDRGTHLNAQHLRVNLQRNS